MRKKGESSANFGTLTRGASINIETIPEEGIKKSGSGGDFLSSVTGLFDFLFSCLVFSISKNSIMIIWVVDKHKQTLL